MNVRYPTSCSLLVMTLALTGTSIGCSVEDKRVLEDTVRRCEADVNARRGSADYIRTQAPSQIERWKSMASKQDPAGLWLLGRCYEEGFEVLPDIKKAAELFHLSADGEFALAANSLGWLYCDGKEGIIDQDYEAAAKCFSEAARLGLVSAYTNIAKLHFDGSIAPDMELAWEYVKKAADNGDPHAQMVLAVAHRVGDAPEFVSQSDELAILFLKKAATQNYADAQYELGAWYALGKCNLPTDLSMAAQLFSKGAAQGHVPSMANYGMLLWNGDGVPQNRDEGLRWTKLAADQGYDIAKKNLARVMGDSWRGQGSPSEKFGELIGVEGYQAVGPHPEGSPEWTRDQIENSPIMRERFGIPEED